MSRLTINWDRLPHRDKFDRLFSAFKGMDRVIVAYSGGVDSTLLLKVGTMALGERCLGVLAKSETLTQQELDAARAVAGDHCFNLRMVEYSELEIPNYADNPVNRCYFCKHELFDQLTRLARELDIDTVAEGSNADDVGDWRPGMKAAEELKIVSPLKDAGLTKEEVRDLARALSLATWDKPSNPCLSSRIAYGVPIDKQKLEQVAGGEKFLREHGFRQVRVRHHGDIARVEVAPEEMDRLLEPAMRNELAERLIELGFRYVTVDLLGYRTGSLNEAFHKRDKAGSTAHDRA